METKCLFLCLLYLVCSCSKPNYESQFVPSAAPYVKWEVIDEIELRQISTFAFAHQSAAAYGKYVFFIVEGRSDVCMYNIEKNKPVEYHSFPGENGTVFHCNQSSFGVDYYLSSDPFPLLYISQRANSDARCFVEVFRIIPIWDYQQNEYSSFSMSLVQTIYFPVMSYSNSLGNVNCVIDRESGLMYTYSRNNTKTDDNFGECKISKFRIPPVNKSEVYLEDYDIQDSFTINHSAINMQGGVILNGCLFIGQGFKSAGYIDLLVIDLDQKKLTRCYDLLSKGVTWEPEGCFSFGESVLLSGWMGIFEVTQIRNISTSVLE